MKSTVFCAFVIVGQIVLMTPLAAAEQYKRVHQEALRDVLSGAPEKAIQSMQAYLEKNPRDGESYFILTVAYADRNRPEEAIDAMERAIDHGLPPGRFLAASRQLTEAIRRDPVYTRLLERYANKPIHGPMVGAVTSRRARFWVRTAGPKRVRIHVSSDKNFEGAEVSQPSRTRSRNDFTTVVEVGGLEPNRRYFYAVQIGQNPPVRSADRRFRTAPTDAEKGFTIAFGGGAGYVPPHERMWETIGEFSPRALLLLGDNVYSDDPDTRTMQRYCYYRRQSRPEFRKLIQSTAVYSIWDDHDFATNDSWGGPALFEPSWKPQVWRTFQNNWVNPGYGGGRAHPGCYYSFSIGDVDFFMLDCRYYREDPSSADPSMLGPVQKAWLKEKVQRSSATFKVLVSSVPWDFRTKGDSPDTWNGYRQERHEIFGFLAENEIEGILLMSADRHRSDAWRIKRDDACDLYEFNSSRLTNQHRHAEKEAAIFSYNDKQSFGLVRFDLAKADPTVTYDVINIDGDEVESLTLKASDLRNDPAGDGR